ncbi:MAG: hypothetical protein AAFY84_18580, partial [Pseudomonadota bacterium]
MRGEAAEDLRPALLPREGALPAGPEPASPTPLGCSGGLTPPGTPRSQLQRPPCHVLDMRGEAAEDLRPALLPRE